MTSALATAFASVERHFAAGSRYRPAPCAAAAPVATTTTPKDPLACCAAAEPFRCVCVAAFVCRVHGEHHHGTHE